jgi:hypothetical protein
VTAALRTRLGTRRVVRVLAATFCIVALGLLGAGSTSAGQGESFARAQATHSPLHGLEVRLTHTGTPFLQFVLPAPCPYHQWITDPADKLVASVPRPSQAGWTLPSAGYRSLTLTDTFPGDTIPGEASNPGAGVLLGFSMSFDVASPSGESRFVNVKGGAIFGEQPAGCSGAPQAAGTTVYEAHWISRPTILEAPSIDEGCALVQVTRRGFRDYELMAWLEDCEPAAHAPFVVRTPTPGTAFAQKVSTAQLRAALAAADRARPGGISAAERGRLLGLLALAPLEVGTEVAGSRELPQLSVDGLTAPATCAAPGEIHARVTLVAGSHEVAAFAGPAGGVPSSRWTFGVATTVGSSLAWKTALAWSKGTRRNLLKLARLVRLSPKVTRRAFGALATAIDAAATPACSQK